MKKALAILVSILFVTLGATGCTSLEYTVLQGDGEQCAVTHELKEQAYKLVIEDIYLAPDFKNQNIQLVVNEELDDNLVLSTDKNIANSIEIKVDDSNKTIKLKGDKGTRYKTSNEKIKIEVGVPVYDVNISAGVTADIDIPSVTEYSMKVSGACDGSIAFNKLDQFSLNVAGAGDLNISGESKNSEIMASGAIRLNAFDFKTENTSIVVSGTGTCNVYATEKLDVQISGAGSVTYDGNPKSVDKSVNGVGSVKSR